VILLRALIRLLGPAWMIVLALAGLGLAMYCLDGFISLGSVRPDRLLNLPSARRGIGHFLTQVSLPGATAGLALLCGLGAMALGALIILGLLAPRRQRLAILERDASGATVAARPGVLRDMARALAEHTEGATSVKRPRLRLSHRGRGGQLRIRATRARSENHADLTRALEDRLTPISEPFELRPRVSVQVGRPGDRVQ
jgi:hypothetical protein